MSATAISLDSIPAGSYNIDPSHSSVGFEVRHMGIATVRGAFRRFEGTIEAAGSAPVLKGTVEVASVDTGEENRDAHLKAPDFFDAERYPEIVYESSSLAVDNGVLTSEGTITVKGKSVPVTATGRLAGPVVTLGDVQKIGVDLDTTVELEAVGLAYNAPLPQGGFVLGKDATISVTLELALVDDEN